MSVLNIATIRNYRKAYPNGARSNESSINEIIDELLDLDEDYEYRLRN